MNSPNKLLISVSTELEALSDAQKAKKMKAYMKEQFDYFGVDATLRKQVYKSLKSDFKNIPPNELETLCLEMWNRPEREWQYLVLDHLDTLQKKNTPNRIELFEALLIKKPWWDTVDGLASKQVGSYFLQFPETRDERIEKWLASDQLWLQRTTLIFQLKYKSQTDIHLLHYLIGELYTNKDFFIQKAIGWSLRQISTTHPQFVIDTVKKYSLQGIAKKEALRKIL